MPDTPLVALHFLDTLISYTTRCRTLGWIRSQSVADKYDSVFTRTKRDVQQAEFGAALARVDSVLQAIRGDSVSSLSSEGYALLKYNSQYLRDHVSTLMHGRGVR